MISLQAHDDFAASACVVNIITAFIQPTAGHILPTPLTFPILPSIVYLRTIIIECLQRCKHPTRCVLTLNTNEVNISTILQYLTICHCIVLMPIGLIFSGA